MATTGITLTPETKAAVQALLTRCFGRARDFDKVLMREPERDADGTLRGYSWEVTEALDAVAQRLGIDTLDVSAPVVAEELGAA
jgi:hypothetical protein